MAKKKLRKKVLFEVPVINANTDTISLAKRNEVIKYYIRAAIKIIDHQRMLVLHAYHREDLISKDTSPRFRVFITKTDYISQYYQQGTVSWRTGRIESLMDYSYYGPSVMICDDQSENSIRKFLGDSDIPAIKLIMNHQESIMKERLRRKHQKAEKEIDRKMREIKLLPKDFMHWIDKEGMVGSRYIYYQYSPRKMMDGYCTHCEQQVKVSSIKHRTVGYCPNCGTKVVFLAESRAKRIADWDAVAYFQKTQKGFVIRYFSVYKKYGEDYRNPKLYIFEKKRDFYEDNKTQYYEWREFRNSGKIRWSDGWVKYYPEPMMIYKKNLKKVLAGTPFQYCALAEYLDGSNQKYIKPHSYLTEYKHYPYLEYLVKQGMFRLVYEHTQGHYYTHTLNKNGKTMPEILGVGKQFFPMIRELDMTMKQLGVYQRLTTADVRLEKDAFLQFCERYKNTMDIIFEVLKYTTLHKAERYCERYIDENYNYYNILHQWSDYIGFCRELGYDLKNSFVLFPKDLRQAHDDASTEVLRKKESVKKDQIRREEKQAKDLLRKYQELYPWTDGRYAVIVPKDLFSIKEEGHILHHCVGTYTTRVANAECIILFIRDLKNPDRAFYTMELKNDRVIQCRGYRNRDMTAEVKRFLDQYKAEVLTSLALKEAV